MLSGPNSLSPSDVLTAASSFVYGRLRRAADDDPSWLGVDALLEQPHLFGRLVRPAGRERFGSDDWGLVTAQVAREAISILVTAAVHSWATQRRLLDLSAANVMLREDVSEGVVVGLRRLDVVVAPADPLSRPGDAPPPSPASSPGPLGPAGSPEADELAGLAGAVEVMDDAKMFHRLVDRALGTPLPIGMMPTGPADQVAAVAAIIATVRRTMRSGNRHLWGTAALALSSTLTHAEHTVGPRAGRDRAALLAARPDLARTIELVTVPATDTSTAPDPTSVLGSTAPDLTPGGTGITGSGTALRPTDPGTTPDPTGSANSLGPGTTHGPAGVASPGPGATPDEITFALRRTCCLLVKLPSGAQCGTCSLRDRDTCVSLMTAWARGSLLRK